MKEEQDKAENSANKEPSLDRREFIKRGGKYGAATTVALATLMSPEKSRAVGSDGAP